MYYDLFHPKDNVDNSVTLFLFRHTEGGVKNSVYNQLWPSANQWRPMSKGEVSTEEKKTFFLLNSRPEWISPDCDLCLKIFLMRGQWKHNLVFLFPWV